MIEYLETLIQDREFEKALASAEQVLLNPDNTAWDLMAVYSYLCHARCKTGEFYGAQVAGQLAVKMAQELKAWDYFGYSSLWLGVCYDRLRQPDNAIATWYDYLAHLPSYRGAAKYHVIVFFNIGLVTVQTGRIEEGLNMLRKAENAANKAKDYRKAHGIRHALIDAQLRYGQLDEIPALLAKCAYYLRHNPTVTSYTQSLVWHLVLRIRYALATKRPHRALRLANRGICMTANLPAQGYHFRHLGAQAYEQLGDLRMAMVEGVQARAAAIEARRFDLEYDVTNYIYGLLSNHPDLGDRFGSYHDEAWDPSVID